MEELNDSEQLLFTTLTDVLDELDPTLGEATEVLTYLLAAVVHEMADEAEYPEDLLALLHSAYKTVRQGSDHNLSLN